MAALPLLESLNSLNIAVYALLGTVIVLWIPKYQQWRIRKAKLDAIPTIGPSGFFSSYIGALKYLKNVREMLEEGHNKYPEGIFKVPLLDRWAIIACGPKMVDDMRKASDDELDITEAVVEIVQADYTISESVHHDLYHIGVVRSALTRAIGSRFADVRDEIVAAFADEIPATDEWVKVPALKTGMNIVCRTVNRFFVGLPLCRDPDWTKFNIQFTIDVVVSAMIINLFPEFLKPLAGRFLTKVSSNINRASKHLKPLFEERLAREGENSEDVDRPNDLITWLLDAARGEQRTIPNLISRVLTVEMAAIHTTSMSFTNALYHLAADPSLAKPLREEIISTTQELGWTKAAMGQMRKMDSFLKECERFSGSGGLSMSRKALKDFTFSDGTVVPAGMTVTVHAFPLHNDKALYENPRTPNPFRFSDMRNKEGESLKHQMVTPDLDYVTFGNGRHSCPGRFFAVNELKALVAHVLMTYDVKYENEGVLPESEWFGLVVTPNTKAEVMFRKRVD